MPTESIDQLGSGLGVELWPEYRHIPAKVGPSAGLDMNGPPLGQLVLPLELPDHGRGHPGVDRSGRHREINPGMDVLAFVPASVGLGEPSPAVLAAVSVPMPVQDLLELGQGWLDQGY
jgi:hypothetical protein